MNQQYRNSHRKVILPKIPLEEMSLPNLSDLDLNSKNSTDVSTHRGSYSLQIIPELKVDLTERTNGDRSKEGSKVEKPRQLKKIKRSFTHGQLNIPSISQYLDYLHSLPQTHVKRFEQKLIEMHKTKEEKAEEEIEKNKKYEPLGFDEHLPDDVKKILFQEERVSSPQKSLKSSFLTSFSRGSLLKPIRRFGNEKIVSLQTSKVSLPDKRSTRSQFSNLTRDTRDTKGFDLFQNLEVNVAAKTLADETAENYKIFQGEAMLHKGLNNRIRKIINEGGLDNVFVEKNYKRHPLNVRIYMDMLVNHGLNPLDLTKSIFSGTQLSLSRLSSSSKLSGRPILIERKYYAYIRLNEQLKQVNIDAKVENLESLQNNLIQGYKNFTSKKEALLKKLIMKDYNKVYEIFKECKSFEEGIPVYKPDEILEKLSKFELRKGEFENITPEYRLLNGKINELLKNWNECLEDYK